MNWILVSLTSVLVVTTAAMIGYGEGAWSNEVWPGGFRIAAGVMFTAAWLSFFATVYRLGTCKFTSEVK